MEKAGRAARLNRCLQVGVRPYGLADPSGLRNSGWPVVFAAPATFMNYKIGLVGGIVYRLV